MNALAITVGAGLAQAVGRYQRIEPPPVTALATILSKLPPVVESWWSTHLWSENTRGKENWRASSGIVVDIDYSQPPEVFPAADERACMAQLGATMPGNLFHLTPHGARLVLLFEEPCNDREIMQPIVNALIEDVSLIIKDSGYEVDEGATRDLARLFFAPNCIAKGVERHDDVVILRREPYAAASLRRSAEQAPAPRQTPVKKLHVDKHKSFKEAAAEWNYDNRRDYPKQPGTCPVCQHNKCFHQLPGDDSRWFCFSTNHPAVGVDVGNDGGRHGDALDLECFETGRSRVDVLRRDGYLAEPDYMGRPTNEQLSRAAEPHPNAPQQEQAAPAVSILIELGTALTAESIAAQRDPVPTGLKEIDEHLGGGWHAGELAVFQAMTGQGKSTFNLMAQCRGVSGDPQRSGLYVSTELRPDELQARRACQILNERGTRCTWRDVLKGIVPLEVTRDVTKDSRVFVLPMRPGPGCVEAIRMAALELGSRFGKPPLIVADYLQALALGTEERRLAVGDTIYRLQALAAEIAAVTVVISSINRTGTAKEKRDSNDPFDFLSLSKEAGEIELAASVLAHLDVKADEDANGWREGRFIVAKSRFGRLGIIGMRYHGASGRFEVDPTSALADDEWAVIGKVYKGTYASANAVAKAMGKNRPKTLAILTRLRAKQIIETRSGYLAISALVTQDQMDQHLSDNEG